MKDSLKISELRSAQSLQPWMDSALYNGFDPALPTLLKADSHLLCSDDNKAMARCSLWWSQVPSLEGETIGVIGHYAALDGEAANQILLAACDRLQEQGVSMAIGPMNGNTWQSYRFVIRRQDERGIIRPAFFLEPDNPDSSFSQWQDAGFDILSSYSSAWVDDLSQTDDRIPDAIKRFNSQGVSFRPLDMQHFESDLKKIFTLSLESFSQNFLYTPVSEQEFFTQYEKVKDYINPALTLLAESGDELLGFVFALPDLAQAQRGETIDTVIVKTVAVSPSGRGKKRAAGLGSILVAEVQRIAKEAGFKHAIHALMHQSNRSRNISNHYAETMREYALLSKSLK